jgi:site-specific recombinase XerD
LIEFDGAKKPKRSNKTKLTIKQIHAIEELELEKGSNLWHTRNYFMFSFYSGGIRFGDLCGLKWKDVKENRLSYRMNKYDKPFSVELNEPQRDILKYYMGGEYIFNLLNEHKQYSPETLRKAISKQNAKVNKWLKKIAELAGIEETVSFHVSRHSFAQYAVNKGLSMYELMQTLRHSSLKTTQQYLKGLDEQLADKAMKKVF